MNVQQMSYDYPQQGPYPNNGSNTVRATSQPGIQSQHMQNLSDHRRGSERRQSQASFGNTQQYYPDQYPVLATSQLETTSKQIQSQVRAHAQGSHGDARGSEYPPHQSASAKEVPTRLPPLSDILIKPSEVYPGSRSPERQVNDKMQLLEQDHIMQDAHNVPLVLADPKPEPSSATRGLLSGASSVFKKVLGAGKDDGARATNAASSYINTRDRKGKTPEHKIAGPSAPTSNPQHGIVMGQSTSTASVPPVSGISFPGGATRPPVNPPASGYDAILSAMNGGFKNILDSVEGLRQKDAESMAQMRDDIQMLRAEVSDMKAGQRKPAHGRRTHSEDGSVADDEDEAISVQEKQGRRDPLKGHPDYNRFGKAVNNHICTLLGLRTPEALRYVRSGVSQEEIEAFEARQDGCIEITAKSYLYDFEQDRDTPFNLEALTVAVDDFKLQATEGELAGPKFPDSFLEIEYIRSRFYRHLGYFKDKYNQLKRETASSRDDRRKREARSSHKGNNFTCRYDVVKERRSLRGHRKIMKKSGTGGISSDETDTERERERLVNTDLPKQYRQIRPWWRGDEFTNFQWSLDTTSRQSVSRPIGRRAKSGSDRRAHVHCDKINYDAPAPPGLPHNIYRPEFLEQLRPFERLQLGLLDWEYDWEKGWPSELDSSGEEARPRPAQAAQPPQEEAKNTQPSGQQSQSAKVVEVATDEKMDDMPVDTPQPKVKLG
ncbi:hypothetical protein OF83DRAFT_1175305 [Amylostereum chailletii]|nr:hypothetical protein OF83DRAFT_1175305 [Amylostereum chailletii]